MLFPAERLSLKWERVQRVGAGLHNLGNTCFLNATLQCLTYTPPLACYLLSKEHSRACEWGVGQRCGAGLGWGGCPGLGWPPMAAVCGADPGCPGWLPVAQPAVCCWGGSGAPFIGLRLPCPVYSPADSSGRCRRPVCHPYRWVFSFAVLSVTEARPAGVSPRPLGCTVLYVELVGRAVGAGIPLPTNRLHPSRVCPQRPFFSPPAGHQGGFCMMCVMQNHMIQAFANSGNAIKPVSFIRDLKSKDGSFHALLPRCDSRGRGRSWQRVAQS